MEKVKYHVHAHELAEKLNEMVDWINLQESQIKKLVLSIEDLQDRVTEIEYKRKYGI